MARSIGAGISALAPLYFEEMSDALGEACRRSDEPFGVSPLTATTTRALAQLPHTS
ncbi:hypothetical protein [Paraliomyxa miuraensis]|uniref:hypothetical protein n=1 Tax=Paraliomyxa miuraensis TaxID=376150 RepID=UPI0022560D2F|nr:hypothetical protein [Paraliomyxa miuraensis]MCX4239192.1 hypothetical protein [Paraliomyxa miuraensis]